MTYLTYRETAALLRCSEKTLYNRVRDGSLRPIRNGRLVLFSKESIEEFFGNETDKDYWDVNNCPIPE